VVVVGREVRVDVEVAAAQRLVQAAAVHRPVGHEPLDAREPPQELDERR